MFSRLLFILSCLLLVGCKPDSMSRCFSCLWSISLPQASADDRFDLCGPLEISFVAETNDTDVCEQQKIAFVSRFGKINNEWMRWVLTGAESAFKCGNKEEFQRWITMVSQFVLFLEDNVEVLGSSPYIRHRLQLEYAIARLINSAEEKGLVVLPQDVKSWLPRTKSQLLKENAHIVLQEKFRSLLIVGAGLNAYWRDTHQLPQELRNLLQMGKLGLNAQDLCYEEESIKYVFDEDFWKLRLGGEEGRDEPMRDFLPALDYVAGLKVSEIWFASTYSAKRKELYEKGILESEDVRCACYLKNGIIYRGRKHP